MSYTPKTDEELRQIARDLRDNKIFTDLHCRDIRELQMAFLVLGLADQKMMDDMKEQKIDFVFEYYDKAGPRTVNGHPVFFSCQTLREEESARMRRFYGELVPAEEGA